MMGTNPRRNRRARVGIGEPASELGFRRYLRWLCSHKVW